MPPSRPYLDMITRTLGINPATVQRQGQTCKLCGGFSPPFDSLDFYKYCSPTNPFAFGFAGIHVDYRRCQDCGFIFTGFFDDWTPDEFSAYVYNADYARIDSEYADIRPGNVAAMLAARLGPWRDIDILDYGSGSGAFAERMAGHGFANITNYDPYSSPARPEGQFSLITCFEVIEHTVSPRACLRDMATFLAPGGCIVFSQPLQPADIEAIRGNWWYIAPRNGHASIFTADALARLGADCGLVFHCGDWLHGFAPADATETSRDILATIGSPFASLRLDAPLDAASQRTGSACRRRTPGTDWSRTAAFATAGRAKTASRGTACCRRSIPCGSASPCRSSIRSATALPTLARSRWAVRSLCPPMHGKELVAETTLAGPVENAVILHTPAPVSPRVVRGSSDDRLLGLAITVYPWVPPAAG